MEHKPLEDFHGQLLLSILIDGVQLRNELKHLGWPMLTTVSKKSWGWTNLGQNTVSHVVQFRNKLGGAAVECVVGVNCMKEGQK